MREWANPPKYGCINNPDYLAIIHNATDVALSIGAAGIQHDDPATNGGAVSWNGGDITLSGCYCTHCMAAFTDALVDGAMNASARAALNITADFSYRSYLLARSSGGRAEAGRKHGGGGADHVHTASCKHAGIGGNRDADQPDHDHGLMSDKDNGHASTSGVAGADGPSAHLDTADTADTVEAADAADAVTDVADDAGAKLLRRLFVTFQQNSTERYITSLRSYINDQRSGTPLSCNNGGRWTTPYFLCDVGMGELSAGAANPGGLQAIYRDLVPEGRLQIMTIPKAKNLTDADAPLIKFAIATAYALGSLMLAPWDVYLPTPNAERYYGDGSEYGPIFGFVRSNQPLFDEATAVDNGEGDVAGAFKLVHTGAGGDGARFELPNEPTHRSNGSCPGSRSLAACEWSCLQDDACVALYVGGTGGTACCLLYAPLVLINGTSLVGASYLRTTNHSGKPPTGPPFVSSASSVSVYPRRPPGNRTVAIHLVNYGYVVPSMSDRTNPLPTVNVTIRNKMVFGSAVCGTFGLSVHSPGVAGVGVGGSNASAEATSSASVAPLRPWCNVSSGTTTVAVAAPAPWAILVATKLP
jgi:hypothetical protein